MELVHGIADPTAPNGIRYEPLTEQEIEEWKERQQRNLEWRRDTARAAIEKALTATDHWPARALEDGVEMPKARRAHRQKLRELYASIAQLDDEGLNAFEIPEPPK